MMIENTNLPRRPRLAGALCGALALLSSSAAAQTTSVPFPLLPIPGAEQRLGAPQLEPELTTIAQLQRLDEVVLTGLRAPDGRTFDLELERIDIERRRFGFQVNGVPAPDLLDGTAVSVWKGQIAGDPFSDVMLGFSNYGVRGWLRTRQGLLHVMPTEAADGGWFAAPSVLQYEDALNAAGISHQADCLAQPPAVPPVPSQFQGGPSQLRAVESIALRECTIAMETDFQFYQIWNNQTAAATYLTTLLSFISDRYEIQTSTVLTFPYLQIYTNSNDPWSTPDNGGNSIDMLNEFVAAWQGNIPTNATLGHMMSGAGLGGGVAYLDVLCNDSFNFGVSGNLAGAVSFPVVQQPSNWDFMVVAHEIGHNFASPHTHDFCPPLDECAPNGYFGSCQSSQVCTNSGTIMSYCHLCSGGTANITTWFHPEAATVMTNASAACNPAVFEVIATAPEIASDVSTTPVMLDAVSGTVTSASLTYQVTGDPSSTTVAMTQQGTMWLGDLPAIPCGAIIEYSMEFEVAGLGTFTAPQTAPTTLYEAVGGVEAITFSDDFESDQGWTADNLGASSGQWERGVPVNDGGWNYDPANDGDGSGSAYLTQNQSGNTDVDGGAVRLTSPAFDMSSPGAAVTFDYYLYLTNADGTDMLLVEASSNGGGWTEVTRFDTDGGLTWRSATLVAADFTAAGITPSNSMRMRFTANDGNPQSIVEAGLDGFSVSSVDCGGVGSNYCGPAAANSAGLSATIRAEGSSTAANNDVTLYVEDLPQNVFGLFVTSQTQGSTPNVGGGLGTLCISGQIGRFNANIANSGSQGEFNIALDLNQIPEGGSFVSVVAGETWNFQAWYRDTIAGLPTSNLSDAVSILFQ